VKEAHNMESGVIDVGYEVKGEATRSAYTRKGTKSLENQLKPPR